MVYSRGIIKKEEEEEDRIMEEQLIMVQDFHNDISNSCSSSSSINGEEEEEDSCSSCSPTSPTPLQDMSSLLLQLPLKRGLSKHYNGKSESFTSLSNVKCLEDLAKQEIPFNKKLKTCKSYGGFSRNSTKMPSIKGSHFSSHFNGNFSFNNNNNNNNNSNNSNNNNSSNSSSSRNVSSNNITPIPPTRGSTNSLIY